MADLIDRAALLEKLDLLARHEDAFRQTVINGVIFTISQEPAVDAVQVVRCKECRHRYLNEDLGKFCCDTWADGYDTVVRDDDYCSYGERRADATD